MNCCYDDDTSAALPLAGPRTEEYDASTIQLRPSRLAALLRWAIPLTALALIPKCPACLAAYVLLLTGMGLSFSMAAAVRWGVIAVSITALSIPLLRWASRTFAHRRPLRTFETR